MAQLLNTSITGTLAVSSTISEGGTLLSAKYASAGHNHNSNYIRMNQTSNVDAMTWGTLTAANGYTVFSHCHTTDGGDWGMCYKGGQIFMQLDGFYYQNEGQYKVLDTNQVSSSNNTASWGSAVTVGTVGGTDLKFTMPANPNTDHYAWSDITSKPISLKGYSGALNSGGWKTLQGRTNSSVLSVSYNSNAASWNSGTYSASLVWGSSDTKGLIDCAYNTPKVMFGGCSTNGSTDDNPTWYMGLSGTSGSVYNLDNFYTSHQSVSSSNNTASWGSAVTVGTVGGTDLKFTMPANPNTDHYAWTDITGRPAIAVTTTTSENPSAATANGFHYVSSSTNSTAASAEANPFLQYHTSNSDFRIITSAYSDSWLQQIGTDFRTPWIYYRRKDNGNWQAWERIANFNSGQTGSFYATSFYAGSDRRLKDNIKKLDLDPLVIINSLKLKEFNFKTQTDKENKYIGLIAQDLKKVLPDKYKENIVSGNERLSINEGKLPYLTLGAVQQLSKKINKLEKENSKLKEKNKDLEKRLLKLEKLVNKLL